jgi:hypothetical protein
MILRENLKLLLRILRLYVNIQNERLNRVLQSHVEMSSLSVLSIIINHSHVSQFLSFSIVAKDSITSDKKTRTLKLKGIFRKSLLYFFKLRDTDINLLIIKLTAIKFWTSETSYLIFKKNHECSAYFWDLTKFDEIGYFSVRVFLFSHNNQSQFCHCNHINNSKCCS